MPKTSGKKKKINDAINWKTKISKEGAKSVTPNPQEQTDQPSDPTICSRSTCHVSFWGWGNSSTFNKLGSVKTAWQKKVNQIFRQVLGVKYVSSKKKNNKQICALK